MRLASVRGRTADDIALQGVIWSVLRPLQPTVEHSLAILPTSTIPFVVGLAGLLLSGAGVVFSAYQTLNHVVAVRHRLRASLISRYVRVFVVLATLMIAPLLASTRPSCGPNRSSTS